VTRRDPVRALAGLLAAAALLAAGCAPKPVPVATAPAAAPELVVVVPGPDGKVGAVTVTRGGEETTLDSAYATARIPAAGPLETGRTTESEVRAIFGAALDAQPPRPTSFMLFFVFGTDTLTPESVEALGKIAAEVTGRPAAEIVAIGHTDRVGSDQQNDALSLQRAERVRQELISLGVSPDRIAAVGRGEREPLVPTADEVAEPRNRRVEITVR
jgi:outer membrane protein OmpA-like peptidoglycan-associated protein